MSEVEACIGLDVISRASLHLRKQWAGAEMPRDDAAANLKARAILFNCSNAILTEFGMGISREEFEGAAILERMAPPEPEPTQ